MAFSRSGGRLGHGMGYYDKYLKDLFETNPQRFDAKLTGQLDAKLMTNKTVLLGLALQEQIMPEAELPLDDHDYLLDDIILSD